MTEALRTLASPRPRIDSTSRTTSSRRHDVDIGQRSVRQNVPDRPSDKVQIDADVGRREVRELPEKGKPNAGKAPFESIRDVHGADQSCEANDWALRYALNDLQDLFRVTLRLDLVPRLHDRCLPRR